MPVTAEAAPHHFTLDDSVVASYDPVFKVEPTAAAPTADVEAVKVALDDGTLDAIATDHAPHTQEDKEAPFDEAPPGMLGLETAARPGPDGVDDPAGAACSRCCCRGSRRASRASTPTTAGPSSRAVPRTCASSTRTRSGWSSRRSLASRSRNTPYAGRKLTGRVRHTVPVVIGEAVRDRRGGAAVTPREALLVLGDGTTFEGEAIGAAPPGGVATGEVVFNTVLSGYQEVITDPSYAGQVIAFTYPHIGNYGVSPDDHESRRPALSRRDRARAGPAPVELAGGRRPGHLAHPARRAGHRGRRHPPPHASHPGGGRHAVRVRAHRLGRRRRRGRARPEAGRRGRARHRRRRPRRDRHL